MNNPPVEKLPKELQIQISVNGCALYMRTLFIEGLSDDAITELIQKDSILNQFGENGKMVLGHIKESLANKIPVFYH
jgi:hypothetical protein